MLISLEALEQRQNAFEQRVMERFDAMEQRLEVMETSLKELRQITITGFLDIGKRFDNHPGVGCYHDKNTVTNAVSRLILNSQMMSATESALTLLTSAKTWIPVVRTKIYHTATGFMYARNIKRD